MSLYDDILAKLRTPEEGMDYAALADSLESQASTLSQGYEATINQKDSAIKTLTDESAVLKAHNYSLMMKQNTSDKSLTDPVKPEDDSVIHGISDLFT